MNPLFALATPSGIGYLAGAATAALGIRKLVKPYVHAPGAAQFQHQFLEGRHRRAPDRHANLATGSSSAASASGMSASGLTPAQRKRIAENKAEAVKRLKMHGHPLPRAPPATRGFYAPRGSGLHGETKSVDLSNIATNASALTTQAGIPLNLATVGSSFFNRIGRKQVLKSLFINGHFRVTDPTVGAVTTTMCRVVVVFDSQPNGAAATWADVIQATTQAGGITSNHMDGMNLNNRDRFKLLMDKRFLMPKVSANTSAVADGKQLGSATDTTCPIQVSEYRYLNRLECMYGADSSPAVIADVRTGVVLMFVHSNTTDDWTFFWSARTRFTDS